MIKLDDISLAFGAQVIFDHVSCNIAPHHKIGLVGRNGSGKTTLLNVISGKQNLDSGCVSMSNSFKCAFMPQDVVLTSERTVLNEALAAFVGMAELLDKQALVEMGLRQRQKKVYSEQEGKNEKSELVFENSLCVKEEDLSGQELLASYACIHSELNELGYDDKCVQAKKILSGLGFENQFDNTVSKLSVGWKMRLVLAKLLLQRADFYLFDEPTNHLDLVAKDWFLQFLNQANFGFILVSHDKYFLDTVCDHIYDISLGKIKSYTGNYSKYIVQKEADQVIVEKKYEEQQKLIKKKMATIDRFRYKASKAKMAQSMLKALDKIEKIEIEEKQDNIKLSLRATRPAGKIVLSVEKLGFAFGDKKIFDSATFQVNRGHKVAMVAPNGTGKSTLLNVVMGKYDAHNDKCDKCDKCGKFEFGHNVKPVFFEQDQNLSLDANNTVLQEVESVCETEESRARVRNLLGAFLFSGEDVNKKISVLSGGEKNRVAMVKILLQDANFLILDEPTNHLDIQAKDVLLNALSSFDGTILFVSHDRSFLNSLATDILELTQNGTFLYHGNYDEYLHHKAYLDSYLDSANLARESKNSGVQVSQAFVRRDQKHEKQSILTAKNDYFLKKELKKLESGIEKLEKEIACATAKFDRLEYGTHEYKRVLCELNDMQKKLKERNEEWESVMLKLE